MKHNPKPEEKKAAGIDDDFAVKKDFAQSCTLRRIAAAVLYLSILFCCTITALKLPSLAVLFPLAAVLLIPPLCFAFNCFAASKVEFAVKVSSSCPRGESCRCEIVLRNDSIIPLPFVRCTLILLNKLNGENRISVIRCSVPALSESRTGFSVKSMHCGSVSPQILRTELTDCFGLFFKKIRSSSSLRTDAKCLFMPTVFDIDAIRNDAFSHDIDSSDYAPGKRGSDHSEVFQLRPYEQGDSLKQVHWKASCKFDDLIVRDASFPIVRSLLICMDVSGCTAAECDAISDVAVSVCSALSDSGTAFTIARPQCGQIEFIDVNASDELPSAAEWLIECEPSESAFAAYVRERGACGYGKIVFIGKEFSDSAAEFCAGANTKRLLCRAGDNGTFTAFSSDNYAEELSDVDL